jgi:hypothetical protein
MYMAVRQMGLRCRKSTPRRGKKVGENRLILPHAEIALAALRDFWEFP